MNLLCPVLILINLTAEPWDAKDQRIITRAKYVCANDYRYASEFPCLKSLTKKPEQYYIAICGDRND